MAGVETLLRPPVAEYRIERSRQELARLSVPTLLYMRDRSQALESRLKWHGTNLECLASDEYDIYEAMRLSARLNNIRVNTERAGKQSDRIRGELVRRQLRDR
jgi:hypothetical protein